MPPKKVEQAFLQLMEVQTALQIHGATGDLSKAKARQLGEKMEGAVTEIRRAIAQASRVLEYGSQEDNGS